MELNTIFNTLAPSSIVQYRTNYIPYYNEEIRNELNRYDNVMTQAIQTNDTENWRVYRNNKFIK